MKKNTFIRLTALFLTVALLPVLSGCSSGRESSEIVEELVVTYGQYGAEADSRVKELLKELRTVNRNDADRWEQIMELWASAEEIAVNESRLPEGLPDTDELCLVALGFQLNPDGSMKDELLSRLGVLLACSEQYPNSLIVCTGGGTAAEAPGVTEAGRMAAWLLEQGVAPERVIVEDQSLTTAQNARFTYDILAKSYPQVKSLAIVSSDYHIATGTLFFGAECILRAEKEEPAVSVVSNAAWPAPSGTLSRMFQAGGLIELAGDVDTAFEIYYDTYDIHELPALK